MIQTDLASIVKRLLAGQYLAPAKRPTGRSCYKVYSGKMIPEIFCTETIVMRLKRDNVLKKKNGLLYISLKDVRKLRRNNIIKSIYKQHLNGKKA
jgi:hypothetical protein